MRDWHLNPHLKMLIGFDDPVTDAVIDGDDNGNELIGTEEFDIIHGFGGDDEIHGLAGNDYLVGGLGDDLLDGGSNEFDGDTASYLESATPIFADLTTGIVTGEGTDTLVDIEFLYGSAFNDSFRGGFGPEDIDCAGGDDVATGGANGDRLFGNAGRDRLQGQTGGDILWGGVARDVLRGGGGSDMLTGSRGQDLIDGGADADLFQYVIGQHTAGKHSTSTDFDTIVAPDFAGADMFGIDIVAAKSDLFPYAPHAIEATVVGGALSKATFDSDLTSAVDADALTEENAVLFLPDAGTYAGQVFLVIDANGIDGYQAVKDLVIRLADPQHLEAFGIDDFLPGMN